MAYARIKAKSPKLPKEVKALQNHWYKLINITGFNDIEDTSHDDQPLMDWHSTKFTKEAIITIEAKQIYFEKAMDILRRNNFISETHAQIWALHIEGLSAREISIRLKDYKKSSVIRIIAEIASEIVRK